MDGYIQINIDRFFLLATSLYQKECSGLLYSSTLTDNIITDSIINTTNTHNIELVDYLY